MRLRLESLTAIVVACNLVISVVCCFATDVAPPKSDTDGLAKLIDALDGVSSFSAEVCYSVTLPSVADDVVYHIGLEAIAVPNDSLFGADYLIKWEIPVENGVAEGFSAYFDGHHYRYRDHRLQEYHFTWDSIPFLAGDGGVQRNCQFVELLPRSIVRELRRMENDTDYSLKVVTDTLVGGKRVDVVSAVQNVRGYDGRYFMLVVDPVSGLPLRMENEYNPGQISEQSVYAAYSYSENIGNARVVGSEDDLMELYPDIFEKYRESNYSIEKLRGLPLPGFSLPTTTGERYARDKGDGFAVPTAVVIIDPDAATAGETIGMVRNAVLRIPRRADIVFAFISSDIERVESLVDGAREGEYYLISARSLARDCGTSVFPTVIISDCSGCVSDVFLGLNKNLDTDVIQSLSHIR